MNKATNEIFIRSELSDEEVEVGPYNKNFIKKQDYLENILLE